MTAHQNSPPLDASSPQEGNVRKRVCKACDRCRLKKSKCDGANPCGRCKADNTICVFGERKKTHDKVYPKGYVEMLEQQQAQLVTGLQELYRRTTEGEGWPGSPLKESSSGHPLTHDILERLGALKQDNSSESEPFEEDLDQAQQRLIAQGMPFMQRQDSPDGGSDPDLSPTFPVKNLQFTDPYMMSRFPPTPPNHSPFPRTQQIPPQFKTEGKTINPPHLQHATSCAQLPSTQAPVFIPTTVALPQGMNPGYLQRQPSWPPVGPFVDSAMDMLGNCDASVGLDPTAFGSNATLNPATSQFSQQMAQTALGSCVPFPDWDDEAVFRTYVNPSPGM
ncbi:hypothetical protein AJ80_05339 [Polytolypa hystricis UAMH7299]|uniref:Zn(2)-C6 fungal-type domain-containing protein n=1 Tax=Polytolypa hystricis (strain UAMH7299) TaxID=1447883 RepID=A0A2B7XWH2_POLH7|nr:hypothetical protein AJ80_05339 [Polytolypa hystricis UAMH7299]